MKNVILTMRRANNPDDASIVSNTYIITLKSDNIQEFILYEVGSISSAIGFSYEAIKDLCINGIKPTVNDPDKIISTFKETTHRSLGDSLEYYMLTGSLPQFSFKRKELIKISKKKTTRPLYTNPSNISVTAIDRI